MSATEILSINEQILLKKIADLRQEIADLHKLLDLRDEQYFEFCETGKMPEQEQK